MTGNVDELIECLLEGPCWIADILPEQVPKDSDGQYFAVERYYLQAGRIQALHRRFAEILLRLNCYFEMAVSFDAGESWEYDPNPEIFAGRQAGLPGNGFLRAMFTEQRAMVDIAGDDTYMTVYDPDSRILDKLRMLAGAEGLFVWETK